MIYAGFDNSFIDINIQPKGKNGKLLEILPSYGSHHTNTNITLQPGGNGFNFCRALATLGKKVTFVGPSSSLFETLVDAFNIELKIEAIEGITVNHTAILNLSKGEIQFNALDGSIHPGLLTPKLIQYYNESTVKSISNIALNPTSIEWVSSLLLSLSDPKNPLIYEKGINYHDKLSLIDQTDLNGIIFIDPCDISHYERIKDFHKLLLHLHKFHGEKYLSVNEYEYQALISHLSLTPKEFVAKTKINLIYHSSERVEYWGEENIALSPCKIAHPLTFNAGVVYSLLNETPVKQALINGMDAASQLISTTSYPTTLKNY